MEGERLLETDRLVLRRFTGTDEDNLVALDSDPEVMRFLSGGAPTPREVVRNDILPRFLRHDDRFPGCGFFAAIERASGEFLGWFSFRRPEGATNPVEVALGFRLRRSAWGKGYATEGARALIRKGFSELGVRRVVATTYEDNLASRRVLEKAGMKLARSFRMTPEEVAGAGTYHTGSLELLPGNDVEYALERDDWERRAAAGVR